MLAQKQYFDYLIDPSFQGPTEFLFYCSKIMRSEEDTQDTFLQMLE